MHEILKVENLRVGFDLTKGRSHIVNGLNLTLQEGHLIGLVGESGSGKSVAASAILGYVRKPGVIENGKVTFTPEPNFTGQAKGIEVQREDKNGTPVNGKYTPFVKPVTPKGDEKETQDIQGAPQKSTPTFTGGKTTVNGKEVTVEIDETVKPTFDDGSTTKEVPGEGTYPFEKEYVRQKYVVAVSIPFLPSLPFHCVW